MAAVDVDGMSIFYEVTGEGEPLVMIQGFGQNSRQWGRISSELAGQHRVILIDNRGTGHSGRIESPITISTMAGDVAGVLNALSIRRASVFGVSMGGVIAQRFALNYPDRVSNLVLGCTTPSGKQHVPAPPDGIRLLFDFEYLKSMTPEQRTMAVFRFMVSEDFIERHPEAYRSYHRATVEHATPTRTFRYQAEAIAGEDTWDELATLTVPTLLITGTEDRIVPCGNSEKMAKQIPGAELVLLQGMRHGFYIEAMEATIDAIGGFIKKNTSQ